MKKPKNLLIVGRKWFDDVYGNTYWSATAYVNGQFALCVPVSYGYGDQWLEGTYRALEERGFVPVRERYASGGLPEVRRFCREQGIELSDVVANVASEDDLRFDWEKEEEE